jgi:hypothetical protein
MTFPISEEQSRCNSYDLRGRGKSTTIQTGDTQDDGITDDYTIDMNSKPRYPPDINDSAGVFFLFFGWGF